MIQHCRVEDFSGNYEEATRLADEAIALAEAVHYTLGLGTAKRVRADIMWKLGHTDGALAYAQSALDLLKQTGSWPKDANLRSKYGASVIAVMPKGSGEVFNAGTTSWVNGLRDGDFFTQQITRNVLNGYVGEKPTKQ